MVIKKRQIIFMYKKYLSLLLFISIVFSASAYNIKGTVVDAQTGELLVGANIIAKENAQIGTTTRLDGSFILRNIPIGRITLECSYISYKTRDLVVSGSNQDLSLTILLDPYGTELNGVTVVASDNSSERNMRSLEKKSASVINVIGEHAIELSPDITVANILQRVSGVTVQKTANSGEAQYAIIRGMDKRYNYTLINGIKIPSPDDKNRYVPMDIFPAELVAHIDVIKALTPDMEGDAIGGAMNLQLKDAPNKLLIDVMGSMGYNALFFSRPFYEFNRHVVQMNSPVPGTPTNVSDFTIDNLKFTPLKFNPNLNGSFSIGDRFLNQRLGIILSVSNQNSYSGSDQYLATRNALPLENTMPNFSDKMDREFSTLQNRLGIHNKVDFQINKNNFLTLYNAYFSLNKFISRNTVQTSLTTGVGNVEVHRRSQNELEKIYNSTLQGKHQLLNHTLAIDWSAAYSKAWANRPDEAELQYNSTDVDKPTLQGVTHRWSHNSDKDLAGYLNLTWNSPFFNKNLEVKAGGMYRHKYRSNFYNEYSLKPVLQNNDSHQEFTTIDAAKLQFSPSSASSGSPVNQNDYTVSENVDAVYGEFKTKFFNKLEMLAGVRMEQTSLNYMTPMPISFVGKSGSQIYTDILPSVHLKYELATNQNLRLSYFSSISRPGFFEVIPYHISEEDYDKMGNPYLKRSQAKNFDFRYAWFPHASEQILAGIFYKIIKDPIEYSLVKISNSTLAEQPQNFGTAHNLGFEFVINKYFGNFGISANYTYTKSAITTFKKLYQRKDPNDPTSELTIDSVKVTRPMQGQADNLANLSLLYKDSKIGLDLQLSMVYTGKFISQVSAWDGLDYWSMPNTSLDFSFQKRVSKKINLSVFAKAKNLLNAAAITRVMKSNPYYSGTYALPDQDSKNSIIVQRETYGQSFLIGIKYKF